MRFEGRELKLFAEPISLDDLKKGSVYFFVNYADEEMLIPTIETVVFIGRDLERGDKAVVYFQDIDSYRAGIRYGDSKKDDHATFFTGPEDQMGHVFEYEHALEELMRCALRRRET